MFKIEVEEIIIHTTTISDEDEQKIKEYIKNNPEKFEFMSGKRQIIKAIAEMEDIELYKDSVDSDSYTNDIRWSEFEECSAEEILRR